MKKILIFTFISFIAFGCSSDDESSNIKDDSSLNNKENLFTSDDFQKSNEDALKMNLGIDSFTGIQPKANTPIIALPYPWHGPYYTTGVKYKVTATPVIIQFLPDTYPGIVAGYYKCDIYKFIGSVQLPSNALTGKPVDNIQNLGFTDFGPNGYTKGVFGGVDSNNVLSMNTTVIHIISNIGGFSINRTIPENLAGVSTVQLPYIVAIL
jgi:hypothetical protein